MDNLEDDVYGLLAEWGANKDRDSRNEVIIIIIIIMCHVCNCKHQEGRRSLVQNEVERHADLNLMDGTYI